LASGFRGDSPWSASSIAVGLWWDRTSWQQKHEAKQSCSPYHDQEAERMTERKEPGTRYPSKSRPRWPISSTETQSITSPSPPNNSIHQIVTTSMD
jgi:hypothetical protein